MRDAKKWGGLSKIGYFPDSFGNIGQAPQILQQADIKAAAFGRGVKPTGFNNAVIDASAYESPYSEMKWQSPDGTEVTGILFANWYCNGNEIPTDEQKAKAYWDEHLENLETFASTTHLLMLNGCDHQRFKRIYRPLLIWLIVSILITPLYILHLMIISRLLPKNQQVKI